MKFEFLIGSILSLQLIAFRVYFECDSILLLLQVWDFSSHLNALAESESEVSQGPSNQAPLFKFGHKDEGFALDWSPLVTGRLLSGNNTIFFLFFLNLFILDDLLMFINVLQRGLQE